MDMQSQKFNVISLENQLSNDQEASFKNMIPKGKIKKSTKALRGRDSEVTRRQAAGKLKIIGLKHEISQKLLDPQSGY